MSTQFNVQWREKDSETLSGNVTGIEDLYYDVTGLDPSTEYEWRVRLDEEYADWTAWESFTTASGNAEFDLEDATLSWHGTYFEWETDSDVEFDLEDATLSWHGTYFEWETDGTVNFNAHLEEGETFIDRINLNVYVTTGAIIDPENPLIITMTPDINEFPPIYTELGTFSNFTLSANKSPVIFSLSGVSPQELELDEDVLVGGDVLEMDLYVPAFAMPQGITIQIDGSHYATYGSALAGSYLFNFTVVAEYEEIGVTEYAYLPVSLLVRNNYSSDRDKLIHDISETFGELGEDSEYRYFEIDGTRVTAAEFIAHQKANGFYS